MTRKENTPPDPSQAPYPIPYNHLYPQEDEIDLRELIQKIWATRRTVLLFLLVTTLIVTGVWSAKSYNAINAAKPEYQLTIDFTFNGIENDQYPNQTPFRLTDLIAPAVLTRVYNQNNLDKYEVQLADFIPNITITPYTPTRKLIFEKYLPSDDDDKKKREQVETQEAQQALETELTQASKRAALISYTPQYEVLPETVIIKLLRDIPSVWADKAIREKGVLRQNVQLYSDELFEPSIINNTTNLMALEITVNKTEQLKAPLNSLATLPAANNIRDTISGHTINDLQKLLLETEQQLVEIPRTWPTHISEDPYAPLLTTVPSHSDKLSDPSVIKNMNDLIALETVTDRLKHLESTLNSLLTQPNISNINDSVSGHTAADLKKLVIDLEQQLVEIPRTWPYSVSDDPEAELLMNAPLYSPKLFDPALLKELDYLISLDVVSQRIRLVQQNINEILKLSHGTTVEDPMSGITAYDLNRLLTELEEFDLNQLRSPVLELGISKAPSLVRFYYKVQIRELERTHAGLVQKAQILQNAHQRYQGNTVQGFDNGNTSQMSQSTQQMGIGSSRGTVIPQLGDAFLDRLIELSNKGDSTSYLQALNDKTIKIEEEVADTEREIIRAKDILRIFNQVNKGVDENTAGLRNIYIAKMKHSLPIILDKLRQYSLVTQRLSAQLRHAQDISSILSVTANSPDASYFLHNLERPTTQETLATVLEKVSTYGAMANRLSAQLRHAQDISNILSVTANSPDTSYFLHDLERPTTPVTLNAIINRLSGYNSIINRLSILYAEHHLSSTGNLYTPAADVSIVRNEPSLVPKKAILTLVLAGILAIMLGIAVGLFQQATRRDSTSDG